MKIALVGITGKIGSQIALEAKKRGHVVTGISRRAAPASGELASFPIVIADIFDPRALAPAAEIGPGEKKGKFRVGARNLIADASGLSRISYGDYADAFVSEIETGRYPKEIATAAY